MTATSGYITCYGNLTMILYTNVFGCGCANG